VTLAVRPERAEIVEHAEDRPGELAGGVENIVYFGTDTTYHVALDGGGGFVVRLQNREGARHRPEVGGRVGILLPGEAVQVLRD
jgi:spermidine/putrescine transport system ATP-binding protein